MLLRSLYQIAEFFHLYEGTSSNNNNYPKWRHYLQGSRFVIKIDKKKSIKELICQVVQTPNQHYYQTKLLGYGYDTSYKQSKENNGTDALSRVEKTNPPKIPQDFQPLNLKQLRTENDNSMELQALHQQLANNANDHQTLKCINGILYRERKLVLSQGSPLKLTLLEELKGFPSFIVDLVLMLHGKG